MLCLCYNSASSLRFPGKLPWPCNQQNGTAWLFSEKVSFNNGAYSSWGIFLDREHQYFAFLVGSTQPSQESHCFPSPELVHYITHEPKCSAWSLCSHTVGLGMVVVPAKGKESSPVKWDENHQQRVVKEFSSSDLLAVLGSSLPFSFSEGSITKHQSYTIPQSQGQLCSNLFFSKYWKQTWSIPNF